jgi:hypothetical protein
MFAWLSPVSGTEQARGSGGVVGGEHDAGVQALSTRNFPDQAGPLRQIKS